MMTITEKMQATINLAREALINGEIPIAAIIFLEDQVISRAYTSEKHDQRLLVHAELKALLDADRQGYSIQERKQMQLFTTLEPCLMCFGAAMSFFIGELVYALSAPDDGALHLVNMQNFSGDLVTKQTLTIQKNILRESANELFLEYAQQDLSPSLLTFTQEIIQYNSLDEPPG
jgi:tRNA(adenine34) deaminase